MDLHREVLAAAERAADAGEVDAHHLGREAEARRDLVAIDVQPLGRNVDVDAALTVGHREARFRAEERLVLDADVVHAAHAHVTLGIRVAVADDHVPHHVRPRIVAVAVRHRRAIGMKRRLLRRALHLRYRLEQLVLDADRGSRTPRLLRLLGGDERHRLAVIADAVGGEHRLVGELEAVRLLAWHVGVREHGVHTGHPQGGGDVELDDLRVRMRAANGDAPEHPGRVQVARVLEFAGHLRRRVVPGAAVADARAPELGLLLLRRRHARAASRTASKIFA